MYWISVTALGALYYFFLKGRKKNKPDDLKEGSEKKTAESTGTQGSKDADPLEQKDLFKVLKNISDPWQRHLEFGRCLDPAYKNRALDEKTHDLAKHLAQAYIKDFSEIKTVVFEKLGQAPKVVNIFKQLAILFEEDHEYENAIEVCKDAMSHGLSDGTKTGYEGRLERLEKKLKASVR